MKNGTRLAILAAIAILILTGIQITLADENSWSTGGPYEATPMSVAIDPTDSMHLYISTLENFVFETTNGGADWSSISTQNSPEVESRADVYTVNIHPFGPDTMFMACSHGAYKSEDAGQTWFRMDQHYPSNLWWVSEITRGNPPVLFLGSFTSAWRSTDCGRNWAEIDWLPGSVHMIKADPVRPNIIYAVCNTSIPNASIWKSADAGLTWQNIHNNIPYDPPDAYGCGIEVDPVDPEIIYFSRHCYDSCEEALLKSTNGGGSWTDITPPDLAEKRLHGVAVSPVDHNTILVCSQNNGVLRSADGGQTWEEASQGIIGTNPCARSLTADPRTGFIYLGMHGNGIYRSSDDGQSWEKISYNVTGARVLDLAANSRDSDTLYTVTQNGLHISTDGAASWQYMELDLPHYYNSYCGGVAGDPYDASYVYASYYGKVHIDSSYHGTFCRSTDGGATWESFTQGLVPGIYTQIAVANYGGGWRRLYLASHRGLFKSDDLGESWSLCQGGLPSSNSIDDVKVSPVDPDLVIVSEHAEFGNYRLWKSQDGGVTWENITNNLPAGGWWISEIACDPVDNDIIYVSLYATSPNISGIYKSTDGGQSWTNINNNLPMGSFALISGLAVNRLNPENLFVWSTKKGIFQSHHGGSSWEDFSLNMETCFSTALALIDPIDTSRVFLGINGGSVWVITRVDTTTAIAYEPNKLPTAFTSSGYPNPFNPSATIEYSLPEEAFVTVDIYDLLGRRVETLISENQQAGSHQVVWDAKDRASGVYFYRIEAGESSDMRKMILLK